MASIIPPVTHLTKSIIRILGCNPGPMTLQGTNTYLLGTGHKRILVDTGDACIPAYIDNLTEVLNKEKASIGTIILTHWHHDHIGGVHDILQRCSVKDCQVYKHERSDAVEKYNELPYKFEFKKIQDNDVFNVDGAKVTAIHTPGHTTDHVVLKSDDGTLFSGDCILGEGTAVFECLASYMNSLKKILDLKPQLIYPGHGNIIEDPLQRIEYYIAHRNQREKQILDFFSDHPADTVNAMDIVKVIYKETPETLWPAAAYNVEHHLDKLQKEGKIEKVHLNNEDLYQMCNRSSL